VQTGPMTKRILLHPLLFTSKKQRFIFINIFGFFADQENLRKGNQNNINRDKRDYGGNKNQ
jgi:hypothetical protein